MFQKCYVQIINKTVFKYKIYIYITEFCVSDTDSLWGYYISQPVVRDLASPARIC